MLTRGRRRREESRESPMAVSAQAASGSVKGRESRAEQRPARAKERRNKGGEPEGAAHEKQGRRGARTRERTGQNGTTDVVSNKGRRKREKSQVSRRAEECPAKGVRYGDAVEDT